MTFFQMTIIQQITLEDVESTHGPDRDMKKTDVKMDVLEVHTTDAVQSMVSTGMIAASLEGVPVQNGLTTLNQVRFCERRIVINCK